MEIFKSWIFEITEFGTWEQPSKYFLDKEKAKEDNQKRLKELKEKSTEKYPWFEHGVDTIEVIE